MARLRMQCSNLNHHLCLRYLKDNPKCDCGHSVEDTEHYLLRCTQFNDIRNETLATLDLQLDLETCLYGNPEMNERNNKKLCNTVISFISRSKRFYNNEQADQ